VRDGYVITLRVGASERTTAGLLEQEWLKDYKVQHNGRGVALRSQKYQEYVLPPVG
jgi:hypothetical protein